MVLEENSLRICLTIHSLQAGGMERVMSELANYFSTKKNVEVHIVLFGRTREVFYEISKSVHIHKPAFEFNNSLRVWSTIRTLYYLRQTIKRLRPDTILSFGEYWNSFVLLALLGLRIPIFISDRGQPDKPLNGISHVLRKLLYPLASGIIAQTKIAQQTYYKKGLNDNIQVIGNPIRFIDSNSNIKRENIILMVGRLIESKQQDKLIEIFASINKPEWKLVLVGYDHLKQQNEHKLRLLATKLRVSERVIFSGKQSNVDQFYLRSKIFAFTSSSEGFPNVIGEAMSAGLPVISFDCVAGPSEMIVDNVNGYLVPLNDENSFSQRLITLMNDDKLRQEMGMRAKKDIEKFLIQSIGNKFYDFIVSCSGKR